ncbi:hypothetical protein N7523_002107 [Penicillium sp. IBT 18751x]|nr:hypothetical protein N7523_008346 [Penicillium sp. IBT 18751x]KAJ6126495.1 hypothetical protein N7523_002107 [Penicillium sp. IBT 18751x]
MGSLLRGKLLHVVTAQQLDVSAQKIWRLRSSVFHCGTLAKILTTFQNKQICLSRHKVSETDGAGLSGRLTTGL